MYDLSNEDFQYDIYLSGSDQIWNTSCLDFDWAYFLPFVKRGKKIAYAPSMGPKPFIEVIEENGRNIKNIFCLSIVLACVNKVQQTVY